MPVKDNGIPRRNRIELNQAPEMAIRDAIALVEGMGANVKLTHAVTLLDVARNLVADFIDESMEGSIQTFGTNR